MFELLIIFICLGINALLAGSETAFIAVSKNSLRALVKQGDEKAKLMLELRRQLLPKLLLRRSILDADAWLRFEGKGYPLPRNAT